MDGAHGRQKNGPKRTRMQRLGLQTVTMPPHTVLTEKTVLRQDLAFLVAPPPNFASSAVYAILHHVLRPRRRYTQSQVLF